MKHVFISFLLVGSMATAKETTPNEEAQSSASSANKTAASAKASLCEGVNKEPDTVGNQPCLQDEKLKNPQETAAYVEFATAEQPDAHPASRYSGPFAGQTVPGIASGNVKNAPNTTNRGDRQEHQQ